MDDDVMPQSPEHEGALDATFGSMPDLDAPDRDEWERQRGEFFACWKEVAERSDLPEDEGVRLAREAKQIVRDSEQAT